MQKIASGLSKRSDSTGELLLERRFIRERTPLSAAWVGRVHDCDLYLAEGGEQRSLLKRLPRSHPAYDRVRAALVEEAIIARRLDRMHFLGLLDAREDAECFLLEYELTDGVLLDRAMRKGLQEEVAVDVVKEVAAAATWFHRREGGPLREIRIDRIIIDTTGRIRLATPLLGFGHGEQEPAWDESWHLAPECWARGQYDVCTEVYALGVLLFTLLSRAAPPTCAEPPRAVLEHARISEPLIDTIMRATRSARGERIPSIAELVDALDPWQSGVSYVSRRALARLAKRAPEPLEITRKVAIERASWGPASPIPADWITPTTTVPLPMEPVSLRSQIEALFEPIPSDAQLTERIQVKEVKPEPAKPRPQWLMLALFVAGVALLLALIFLLPQIPA